MMRYTGTQHTQQEAESIMRDVRIRLRSEKPGPRDEKPGHEVRRRDNVGGFGVVHKTIENARVAAADQPSDWAEWEAQIEAKIEERVSVLREAFVQHFEAALDEVVDRLEIGINGVRRDLNWLRNHVDANLALSHQISALKSEVARARSQAPDFQSELSDLQEDVEKLQKTAGSLRAQHSTLEFRQRQAEKEKVTLTAVQLSAVGGATREVLQRLRASGLDLS
jgi:predicted  nucleic acid-binding Zn-ribbon protein